MADTIWLLKKTSNPNLSDAYNGIGNGIGTGALVLTSAADALAVLTQAQARNDGHTYATVTGSVA